MALFGNDPPPLDQLYTVGDFIRWSASRMNEAEVHFGHGTVDALDEAAALVFHALHLPPDTPDAYLSARLTRDEKQQVFALVGRRIDDRIPAPYLTGQAWFMELPFFVDERVLIPRSPMAELIQRRFSPWLPQPPATALDLGTGSGCLGIALATVFQDAQVVLTDVDPDALAVAEMNVAHHGLEGRLELLQGADFTPVAGRRFDLIVTNPPYVGAEELAVLPDEYDHEPRLALAAGEDGLEVVDRLLAAAHRHLTPRGWLVLEVGSTRATLERAYPQLDFIWPELEHGGEGVGLIDAPQLAAVAAP